MKVFISWSTDYSRDVAAAIKSFLESVLQRSNLWMSTDGIPSGAVWIQQIFDELKGASAGIVVVTKKNKSNPWLLFEAGAISKGVSTNRVCIFLVDLKSSDVQDPLRQFNHTERDPESLWKLVKTINESVEGEQIDTARVRKSFDALFPSFAKELEEIDKKFVNEEGADNSEITEPSESKIPFSDQEVLSGIEKLYSIIESMDARLYHMQSLIPMTGYSSKHIIRDINSEPGDFLVDPSVEVISYKRRKAGDYKFDIQSRKFYTDNQDSVKDIPPNDEK